MITIDSRVGSKELLPLFPAGRAALGTLAFGDLAFWGNGPQNPVQIGFERKTVPDMLASIHSNRFAGHQLPGLCNTYYVTYLVIEGAFKAAIHDGVLHYWHNGEWRVTPGKPQMYREFINTLNTYRLQAGIQIERTESMRETVAFVNACYHWWEKAWEAHTSLSVIHYQGPRYGSAVPVSIMRKIAACLPGVGWELSDRVIKQFATIEDMVTADAKQWTAVSGIGKVTAERIIKLFKEVHR